MRSMVLEGTVWGPHSLHTPEVTPQRPDLRQEVGPAAAIRRTTRTQPAIARVGQHPKPHPPALRGVRGARWSSNTRYCAPPQCGCVGVAVGGATVGGEPPSGLQDGPPFAQVCCEGAAAGFNSPGPLADSALFLAEQAQVDGVGVVGRQQLAAFAFQAQQFTVKLLVLLGGVALAGVDLNLEGGGVR